MITKKVIEEIYKKYGKRPKSADELNLALLFENLDPKHSITIDDDEIVIGSLDPMNPFSRIPLETVHAIIEFDAHVAIVLHSSIIFLNKEGDGVSVHIKPLKPSLGRRLTRFFNSHKALA